jgi:hypothetical protein
MILKKKVLDHRSWKCSNHLLVQVGFKKSRNKVFYYCWFLKDYLYTALNTFLTTNNPVTPGKPKAYLNWILLDNQFSYVSSYSHSGAIPVSNFTAGTLGTSGYIGILITRSSYLYIHMGNFVIVDSIIDYYDVYE